MYDPILLAEQTEALVIHGRARRYYRLARGGRWYGGIATADCCGCPLRCSFCWSGKPRDNPDRVGKFYQPEEVFRALSSCARKKGYRQLRLSGNEPTLGKEHLLAVLGLVDESHYHFILETSGILIDEEYARELAGFRNLHVRVSLKGTNPQEFSLLTGALPEVFSLQLTALRNLTEAGVSCHPAVMLSFSPKDSFRALKDELNKISPHLTDEIEEEYIFLYPHVEGRLIKSGLKPLIAYSPDGIPKELV
ncbi:MAG: radical SAM protein [Deltaproteobacteria bacterium]|nr:MAG: radical SAM protein [Deltaproteobacteria bacterium]